MSQRTAFNATNTGHATSGLQTSRRATNAPEIQGRPDLRLVQGKKSRPKLRLKPHVRVMFFGALVAVALFGIVAFHVVLSQGQFKLEAMNAKVETEQSQYERMRLQVATLESPTRIAGEAENRLGLVPTDQVTAVTPSADDVPHGLTIEPDSNLGNGQGLTDWTKIKPQLSSSAP